MSTILKSNLQAYLNALPDCNELQFANCVRIQVEWYRGIIDICSIENHTAWGGSGCSPCPTEGYGVICTEPTINNEFLVFNTFDSAYDFGKRVYLSLGYTQAEWASIGIPNFYIYSVSPYIGHPFGWVGLDAPFDIYIWDGGGENEDRRCQPEKTNICLPIAYCNEGTWGSGDLISGALQAELNIPP